MSKSKMGKRIDNDSLRTLYTSLESAKTSDKPTAVDENTEKTVLTPLIFIDDKGRFIDMRKFIKLFTETESIKQPSHPELFSYE